MFHELVAAGQCHKQRLEVQFRLRNGGPK